MTRGLAVVFVACVLTSCVSVSQDSASTTAPSAVEEYWTADRINDAEPVPVPSKRGIWGAVQDFFAWLFGR